MSCVLVYHFTTLISRDTLKPDDGWHMQRFIFFFFSYLFMLIPMFIFFYIDGFFKILTVAYTSSLISHLKLLYD